MVPAFLRKAAQVLQELQRGCTALQIQDVTLSGDSPLDWGPDHSEMQHHPRLHSYKWNSSFS